MKSKLLSIVKDPLTVIYEHNVSSIIQENVENMINESEMVGTHAMVNGFDKVTYEVPYVKNIEYLEKKNHLSHFSRIRNHRDLSARMDMFTIGNYDTSLDEAMNIIKNIRKEAGPMFFGAIMSYRLGGKIIRFNPLHPIIMSEIKENNIPGENAIYTIYIYTFQENCNFQELAELKTIDTKEIRNEFVEDIGKLLASIQTRGNFSIIKKNFQAVERNYEILLEYEEKVIDNETGQDIGSHISSFLTPVQIANINGLAHPYYGAVFSRGDAAWNLTPMWSCNISSPSNTPSRASGICVKGGNPRTMKGISRLNHANFMSPLNSSALKERYLIYVNTCIDVSIALYFEEPVYSEDNSPLTFIQWKEQNLGETRKEYLIYLKEFKTKDKKETKTIMNSTEPIDLGSIEVQPQMTQAYLDHMHGRLNLTRTLVFDSIQRRWVDINSTRALELAREMPENTQLQERIEEIAEQEQEQEQTLTEEVTAGLAVNNEPVEPDTDSIPF